MANAEEVQTFYGRRKLDPGALAEQQEGQRRAGNNGVTYGRRKVDATPATAEAPGEEGATAEPGTNTGKPLAGPPPSIARLRAMLEEKPQLLDAAIEHELRQERPRKGAVELFLEIEQAAESPREDVITKLEASIA